MLHTSDNGKTWDTVYIFPYNEIWKYGYPRQISFPNEKNGILAYYYDNSTAVYSHLCYTENGGRNWTEVSTPVDLKVPEYLWLFSDGTGYMYNSRMGQYAITKDNGKSWVKCSLPSDLTTASLFYPYDTNNIFLVGDKRLFYSTDRGNSWAMSPYRNIDFDALLFRTANEGVAISRKDEQIYFLHTKDKGKNWSEDYLFWDNGYERMGLYKGLGSKIYITGSNGLLMSWDWETGFSDNKTSVSLLPPKKSRILSIYPNPVLDRSSSYIKYELSDDAKVELNCYDITGRFIGKIFEGNRKQGRYITGINNKLNLSHGVYIIELKTNNERKDVKKIVVMRR